MSVFMRTGNRVDLEREIHRAVKQRGSCYVRDQMLHDQLQAATEEQVMAWKQSFSERERLTCQPYHPTDRVDSLEDGVVFTAL